MTNAIDKKKLLDVIHLKGIKGEPLTGEEAQVLARAYSDARQEVRNWIRIAVHFGDVLSASAWGIFDKKSSPKSERDRQVSICETVSKSMRAGTLVAAKYSGPEAPPENVAVRAEKALLFHKTGKI